jgi:hypothetical protein
MTHLLAKELFVNQASIDVPNIKLLNDDRFLTKSRFKMAIECPSKLFYTKKEATYADTKKADLFLQALADGGFQVGELAKLMYPRGVEVEDQTFGDQIFHTLRLLEQENVTIYEAAIAHDNLFARVDILRKTGNSIELIEVKAKSVDSTDEYAFRNKRGGIDSGMLPYLQDVAFQTYLFDLAFPGRYQVSSYLMLADKSKICSIDELNQQFKIHRLNKRPVVTVSDAAKNGLIGDPILTTINVDDIVKEIIQSDIKAPGLLSTSFSDAIKIWSDNYSQDVLISTPVGSQCVKCEFQNVSEPDKKSGLEECWNHQKKMVSADFAGGTVLDIWNFGRKQELIDAGIYRFSEIQKHDLMPKSVSNQDELGLSTFDRQWMQVSGEMGGGSFYLDRELMLNEMHSWSFPYHFIDFETCRMAIPFFKGQAPYENIAFQFSHHMMNSDGSVEHKNQYLGVNPGEKPNYNFVRELKKAVGQSGTIFMWWPHENTTLNAILEELNSDSSPPNDLDELKEFILSITYKNAKQRSRSGERVMVDLCTLSKKAFYHPLTKASSSIKKVLPAVLESSEYLQEKYSHPIYGKNNPVISLNFDEKTWWRKEGDAAISPYHLLPKIFEDFSDEELLALDLNKDDELAEGGAASTAYSRLQFEDMPEHVREKICESLLKYCELDTLAMAMIVEAWRSWLQLPVNKQFTK